MITALTIAAALWAGHSQACLPPRGGGKICFSVNVEQIGSDGRGAPEPRVAAIKSNVRSKRRKG